jgi:hypothetical protein
MVDMIPIVAIVFTFCVPAVVIIVIAVLRNRQRLELIRQGINPDEGVFPGYPKQRPLLWGLVLSGLGVAGIVQVFWSGDNDLMTLGLFFIGAGLAMLLYWRLTKADREHAKKMYEERFAAGLEDPKFRNRNANNSGAAE